MKESYLIVPEEFLALLKKSQEKIISILEESKSLNMPTYLTERQAMQLFNRKATWFWKLRREKILPYSKIGASIYYSLDDIQKALAQSKVESQK